MSRPCSPAAPNCHMHDCNFSARVHKDAVIHIITSIDAAVNDVAMFPQQRVRLLPRQLSVGAADPALRVPPLLQDQRQLCRRISDDANVHICGVQSGAIQHLRTYGGNTGARVSRKHNNRCSDCVSCNSVNSRFIISARASLRYTSLMTLKWNDTQTKSLRSSGCVALPLCAAAAKLVLTGPEVWSSLTAVFQTARTVTSVQAVAHSHLDDGFLCICSNQEGCASIAEDMSIVCSIRFSLYLRADQSAMFAQAGVQWTSGDWLRTDDGVMHGRNLCTCVQHKCSVINSAAFFSISDLCRWQLVRRRARHRSCKKVIIIAR